MNFACGALRVTKKSALGFLERRRPQKRSALGFLEQVSTVLSICVPITPNIPFCHLTQLCFLPFSAADTLMSRRHMIPVYGLHVCPDPKQKSICLRAIREFYMWCSKSNKKAPLGFWSATDLRKEAPLVFWTVSNSSWTQSN